MTRQTKTEQNVENTQMKGQELMTNQENKKQEFNYFNFIKFMVLKEYYKNKLQNKDVKEITYQVKFNDYMKNTFFSKNNAFKFVKVERIINEVGQKVCQITIKDINLDAKATSKAGKEFNVFTANDKAKAFGSAERALAQ